MRPRHLIWDATSPPLRPPTPSEVLCGSYEDRADVWSCGVVLYILLSGRPPFCAARTEGIFKQIMNDGVPNM